MYSIINTQSTIQTIIDRAVKYILHGDMQLFLFIYHSFHLRDTETAIDSAGNPLNKAGISKCSSPLGPANLYL